MGTSLAERRSPTASSLLAIVALLALVGGLPLAYLNHTILDSETFASRTRAVMNDPVVEDRVVDDLTDAVIENHRELLTYRPLVRSIVRSIVTSTATKSLVESVVTKAHRSLLDPDDGIFVTIDDLALLARTQIAALAPELLDDGRATTDARWTFSTDAADRVAASVNRIRGARLTLLIVAAVALFGTAWLAADRRRGALAAGRVLVAAGLALTAFSVLGRIIFVASYDDPDAADLADALWSGYLGGLARWAAVTVAAGLVVAGFAGWNPLRADGALRDPLEQRHGTGARRAVPAAVAVAAGTWAILDPLAAVQLVVSVGAAAAIVIGGRSLIALARDDLAARRATARDERSPSDDGRVATTQRGLAAAALALLALAVAGLGWFTGADHPSATPTDECNGSSLYCDIPLNELTLAATHNSMSAAADGYFRANHDTGIIDQLDAGYRGLLIDTWYGYEAVGGVVVTDRINVTPAEQAALEAELGPEAVAEAAAAQERQLGTSSDRAMFLCHGYCELGATPLVAELERIRAWIDANPRQVLVIIIQDEVSPADTATAFESAGLAELAIELDIDSPVPSPGEMLDRGTPLLVMMENETGDVPWLHDAFTFTQDTPFSNETPDDFRCDDNRGDANSPFLLINHFVSSPDPVAAETSNTFEHVSASLNDCAASRAAWPSMIAVDYWSRGNVLDAVEAQNLLSINIDDA